uniref:phage tail protein n=1 Tax=Providencia sp. PROV265 TaxID=2949953 RepID=UPI00234AD356|nr:phage tail protein [Providencia sp. PROV265]
MKYFALLTKLGENLLAQATALGTKIELTQMAVGDGGGKLPTPDTNQTKLIAEKRRAAINTLFIDDNNKNQIIAEQIIPEQEGGWWIREIGLFDKAGNLIAVANCPETYKPQLTEGSGRTQSIRMVLIVSHTESVTLKIDPSVVLATREYVNTEITVLDKKIDALSAQTKLDLNKKFDKANISGQKGNDNDKVPSLNLFTTETGKLANKADLNAGLERKLDKTGGGLKGDFGVLYLNSITGNQPLYMSFFDAASKLLGFIGRPDSKEDIALVNSLSGAVLRLTSGNRLTFNDFDVMTANNVTQTVGTSTTSVMSQKAVKEALENKINTTAIVQSTGTNQYSIMSQKSVSDALELKVNYSAIVQTTGQNQYSVMSQKSVTNSMLGIEQVWKDMLSERKSGTTYTNTTGKPISVSITQLGGMNIALEITVNGVLISNPSSTGTSRCFITFIVPSGGTYKVAHSGSDIINWSELR